MRIAILAISLFALLLTMTAELSYAHAIDQDTLTHIFSDTDNSQGDNLASDDCEMVCGTHHHHIANNQGNSITTNLSMQKKHSFAKELVYLPDFVYGLKRPPKA